MEWRILHVREDSEPQIVLYAGQKGSLNLKAFKLHCQSSVLDQLEGVSGENKEESLEEIDCYKGMKTTGDEYVSIKITKIKDTTYSVL